MADELALTRYEMGYLLGAALGSAARRQEIERKAESESPSRQCLECGARAAAGALLVHQTECARSRILYDAAP